MGLVTASPVFESQCTLQQRLLYVSGGTTGTASAAGMLSDGSRNVLAPAFYLPDL